METSEAYFTSEAYLQQVFTHAAVGIAMFSGPDFIINVANPVVCTLWGRTEADVLGKPLFVALPEAAGQGFEELLTDVMQTNQPFIGKELPATINRNGQLHTVYFDFVYEPLPDADGQVSRILLTASDATERRLARRQTE
ncbi:MAG: PAS domain-containing protein, partial [Spirosoma sp.]|nr:PAS domain-containing protein [Spirosoma sp.]